MKYFLFGVIVAVVALFISYITFGRDMAYIIPGGIGLFFIAISMLFSGAMVNGDQMRANFATESEVDRRERTQTAVRSGLIGLPNMLLAGFLYILMN